MDPGFTSRSRHHQEGHADIRIPLPRAGAWLVEAYVDEHSVTRMIVWVNKDALVLSSAQDKEMLLYAADASTGQPLANQTVNVLGFRYEYGRKGKLGAFHSAKAKVNTDAQGLAYFKKEGRFNNKNQYFIYTGTNNDDLTVLSNIHWYRGVRPERHQIRRICVAAFDRPVYKPGETLQGKLWACFAQYGEQINQELRGQSGAVYLHTPRGERQEIGRVVFDEHGAHDLRWDIPKHADLGLYSVSMRLSRHGRFMAQTQFRVEKYKKPEYEVTVTDLSESHTLGDEIKAQVSARYYTGSALTEGRVHYTVRRKK